MRRSFYALTEKGDISKRNYGYIDMKNSYIKLYFAPPIINNGEKVKAFEEICKFISTLGYICIPTGGHNRSSTHSRMLALKEYILKKTKRL